jgi:hypothetical protein
MEKEFLAGNPLQVARAFIEKCEEYHMHSSIHLKWVSS